VRNRSLFVGFVLGTVGVASLVVAPFRPAGISAQETPPGSSSPAVGKAVRFAVSEAARDLPPAETKPEDTGDLGLKQIPTRVLRSGVTEEGSPDAVVQDSVVTLATPAPSVSFDGISNQDNFNAFGFRVSPPDTNGDVGPNHYVQMVNLLARVYDKTGAPLTPPFKLSSLFAPLGGQCAAADQGDPVVVYDPLADRWLLSQFAFASFTSPPYFECIAISQTSDPAGAYFLYAFQTPGANFPDYPKLAVWHDGYYMTVNQFLNGGPFNGTGAYAFERQKMLAGDPTASFIYFNLDLASHPEGIGGALPSDLDGLVPPPPGTPNYFSYFIATEFGDPSDGLRMFEFHADFVTPANSTFTERADSPIAVAAFNPLSPAGRDDIEQPPPASAAASLDAISDRLMHRLAYRKSDTYESLVVNHTVNVGTGTTLATHQAGVRYYELRRPLPGGSWTVAEQATFAPDTHNRWMGSAAQDHEGSLCVGYSVSSLTTHPSVRYACRLATDAPGGLFQGETSLVAGSGVQTNTGSRWGDYSALNVDPTNDCDFWYTNEYYTAASQATSTVGWVTRIGMFRLSGCTPAGRGIIEGAVINAVTGMPISGAVVQTTNGFNRITGALGTYSMATTPGTYDMVASKPGFESAVASGVVVTASGTTTQNFALTPIPIIMTAGDAVLIGETCGPATGAIDPGEEVTVSFSFKNTGAADTTDLVVTLLPMGGVTNPGAPQSYGVVAAGGASVSRSFTFTADPALNCGDDIIATLSLQDVAASLGTLSFTLKIGALSNLAVTDSYSTGDLATPIPDLSTIEVPIEVPDAGVISDVNVRLRLNHTFDGDLEIRLVAPDGTAVLLSNNRGGAGDNFGSGPNNCSGTFSVFDDSAATPIASGVAPFAGSFRPDQPLSALNGKASNGTWKLRISDTAALDVGTVGCVQLEISRRLRLCCPFVGGEAAIAPVPPAVLTAESCHPANQAPDPDELVTVGFPLLNVGLGPTSNLTATLLSGGGVNTPSGPQSYGALSPVSAPVSRPFSFVPSGTCGGTITATLQLQDGLADLGTALFNLRIGSTAEIPGGTFSNPGTITIPAGAPGSTSGAASPYPSSIGVAGVTGTVSKVTATLTNMNHTFPDDIDILLVGPAGQRIVLMSDAGGSLDLLNVTLTFDDSAAGLPDSAQITSGTFRPTNFGTGDAFPAPAPGPPHGSALSAFNGTDPNGTWSLFVTDDAGADVGNIAAGWSLTITSAVPVCCDEPCSLSCPADITQGTDPGQCTSAVTFSNPQVSGSCGIISCSPPSGSAFPVGTTSCGCTATRTQDGGTTSCGFSVNVLDTEPPVISNAAASPSMLWPPDHRMVNVLVSYDNSDNCIGTCSLSVNSNEPIKGLGAGDTAPDWEILDAHHVRLRAERSGTGSGRIYTITITCTDLAGNTSSQQVTVQAPHDQRGGASSSLPSIRTPNADIMTRPEPGRRPR